MNYIEGVLRKNAGDRWCIIDPNTRNDLYEISSGCVIELYEKERWTPTRIEYFDGDYNSVDGYSLFKERPARKEKVV